MDAKGRAFDHGRPVTRAMRTSRSGALAVRDECLALQLRHLDMKREDTLHDCVQLSPRWPREGPHFRFLHAILEARL